MSQSAPGGINLSEADRQKSRQSINGFRSNARGNGHELVVGARFAMLNCLRYTRDSCFIIREVWGDGRSLMSSNSIHGGIP